MRVGVNVVAYATGREPPSKLDVETDPVDDGKEDVVERDLTVKKGTASLPVHIAWSENR